MWHSRVIFQNDIFYAVYFLIKITFCHSIVVNMKQNGLVMEMMIHVQNLSNFGSQLLLNWKTWYPMLNLGIFKKVRKTNTLTIKCMILCLFLIHLMEGVIQ